MGKKRTYLPVVKEPVPEFTPVPRKYRYDGWTPERQKAFIAALAETGCVDRAARLVNIAQTNCYELRRAPGAEEFRRAWDAALDFGLKRLKDIAFERAIEGHLVPVFVGGKLMGFRRVYNDKLLMFCLRHYGQDAGGKRVTVNYFSTRASAGAVLRDGASTMGSHQSPTLMGTRSAPPQDERIARGAAGAEASATTVRTVITGRGANDDGGGTLDEAAAVMNAFEGVRLDAEAEAAIRAAIEACAARAREARAALDEGGEAALDAAEALGHDFVRVPPDGLTYRGTLEFPRSFEEVMPFAPGESHWSQAGAEMPPEWAEVARRLEAVNDASRDEGGAAPTPPEPAAPVTGRSARSSAGGAGPGRP
ncbi:MAG: hypothetical protein QOK17_268 [Sphingomonadales bacterium]|jgi:hypothetical protein|nr:hypothetical protein [Sphingomonadales bacterium]